MYEDRVAIGAASLDRVKPGWEKLIALDRLAMESCDQCILGQIYGGYPQGMKEYAEALDDRRWHYASSEGFNLTPEEQDTRVEEFGVVMHRFKELAAAWRREIEKRLAAEAARTRH